jgi:hypothetical protein
MVVGTSDGLKVIIAGDANLCVIEWNEKNYTEKIDKHTKEHLETMRNGKYQQKG